MLVKFNKIIKTILLKSADYSFTMTAPLHIMAEVGSALDEAWELNFQDNLPIWGSVLVENQIKGRGRRAKNWHSPVGNLYVAWRLPLKDPFDVSGAAISVAVLLKLAFKSLGLNLSLKWPNDLIFEGTKVGGILLEARQNNLIAGIGLNLRPIELNEDLRTPPPGHLIIDMKAQELWIILLEYIFTFYDTFKKNNSDMKMSSYLMKEAEKDLFWKNDLVKIFNPSGKLLENLKENTIFGFIDGLSAEGLLRIKTSQKIIEIWGGTISKQVYNK